MHLAAETRVAAETLGKPQTLCGDLQRLPPALQPLVAKAHWVLWRWQRNKSGKWTKVPYQPTGAKAKNNDPATWSTYGEVMACVSRFDGIGFCLLHSGIAAFDIDHCRDHASGELHPWARQLVDEVTSYTEITVSGTGLRIIGWGGGQRVQRKLAVVEDVSCEAYRQAERYIVITGNPLPGSPSRFAQIDAHIDSVVAELDSQREQRERASRHNTPQRARLANHDAPVEDELEDLVRYGCRNEFGGDRSRAVWRVANEMIRRGYTAERIVSVLTDPANAISDHVRDQGRPQEYARRQVESARDEIALSVDDQGRVQKTPQNIRVALAKLGVSVRYDRFADRILISGLNDFGPALDDAAVIRLWLTFEQRYKLRPPRDLLTAVLQDTARLNSFHPVRNYLDALAWDGRKRLDAWLTDYAGADDSEYTRAVGALVLIAAVRRIRQPGCKFDEMVVLETPEQGTEKSSAIALLAVEDDWFSDDLPLDAEDKRVIEALRGRWLVEAAELSGMKRTDVEHLKAFLSRRRDRARLSYDRLVTEVPRQCVIIGTTNSEEYLRDASGNRRFWPVRVKRFDLKALERDRDQLWAEAATREASGASVRLEPRLWPAAAAEQDRRLIGDPILDALQSALGDRAGKISTASLWEILDIRPGQRTQDHNNRLGTAMRKLGWRKPNGNGQLRIDGRVVGVYVRGDPPYRLVEVIRTNDSGLLVDYRDDRP